MDNEIRYATEMIELLREQIRDPNLSIDEYMFNRFLLARMMSSIRAKEVMDAGSKHAQDAEPVASAACGPTHPQASTCAPARVA